MTAFSARSRVCRVFPFAFASHATLGRFAYHEHAEMRIAGMLRNSHLLFTCLASQDRGEMSSNNVMLSYKLCPAGQASPFPIAVPSLLCARCWFGLCWALINIVVIYFV